MYYHPPFAHQNTFSFAPIGIAVPEHHYSSSEGSELYPFGARAAGDTFVRDGSSDSDIGSLAANDEPYLPDRSQAAPPGHPSPLQYTVAPEYFSGHSVGNQPSPGHHRSYSNDQNDNGYSGEYPHHYRQSSYASNDAQDYTQDGPYVPPGFFHPPPLAAQSQRHFAYHRAHQPPSAPPPQAIPHPLIAPQIQRDLPDSPSSSSSSSEDGHRPNYVPHGRSSMPASPPCSQGQPDLPEPTHAHQQLEAAGSEPPPAIEEPERSQQWHETDKYLRNQIGIPEGTSVNLWALPEPPPGQKPQQPLPILVKLAIHGCDKGMLTLQEIYQALEDRFQYFANLKSAAWKNSIRHNLSLNQVFRSCDRPITEPGKGRYWSLDISKGEGYKRERRRKRRNAAPYNGTRDLPGGIGNQLTLGGESSDPDHDMDDEVSANVSASASASGGGGGGKAAPKTKKGRKRGPYTRITVPQPSIPGSTGITAGGAAAAVTVSAHLKSVSPVSAAPSPITHPSNVGGSSSSGVIYSAPQASPQQSLVPPLSHIQQQKAAHHHHHHHGVILPSSAPATLPYPITSYTPGMYFNRQPQPTFGQPSLSAAPGSFASISMNQPPLIPLASGSGGGGRRDASIISVSSDSPSSPGSERMS